MTDQPESSLVRIFSKKQQINGAGFLLPGGKIVTCAHVIDLAAGSTEEPETIQLDFPFSKFKKIYSARVIQRLEPKLDGSGDMALLELLELPPDDACPAQLVEEENIREHCVRVCGYPEGREGGVWVTGCISGRTAEGWVQVDGIAPTGYAIQQGFSGSPVWDEQLKGVVGMIVAADPTAKSARMIPGETLREQLSKRVKVRLFMCYRRDADLDQNLANYLQQFLEQEGHEVFIDTSMRAGEAWLEEIDRQIKRSDFLIVLLSQASADSEMLRSEVIRAYKYKKQNGHPSILPVRIRDEGLLPYSIEAFLDPFQYVVWKSEADHPYVAREILKVIQGFATLPKKEGKLTASAELRVVDDGRVSSNPAAAPAPLPEYDPRFLELLSTPGGAVRFNDQFYIERDSDNHLKRELAKEGSTTTIRAPRQSGKSSLLVRGMHDAQQRGAKVIHFDVQRVDSTYLENPDCFLKYMGELILRKLRLSPEKVNRIWEMPTSPQDKLTLLFEDHIFPQIDEQLILAMDEVDRLLTTSFHNDFFSLVRFWHNNRAIEESWCRLNMALVISTEPYLLIANMTQSPFNVGYTIYLDDFDDAQTRELNRQHKNPVKDNEFAHFMKLLGGHPYLTRKALYTLVTERMGWGEMAAKAATDQGPFGDHLRHYRWLLHDDEHLREGFRQVIQQNTCSEDIIMYRLLRAGLIKASAGGCQCRCDLYRLYFQDYL